MRRLPGEGEGGQRVAADQTKRVELDQLAHRQVVEHDERQVDDFQFLPAILSRLGG